MDLNIWGLFWYQGIVVLHILCLENDCALTQWYQGNVDNFPYFDRLLAGLTICMSCVICLLIHRILFDCIPWNPKFLLLGEAVQGRSRSWPPNVKIILLTQNPSWSLWCPSDRVFAGLKCWAQVSSPGQRKLFLFCGVEGKGNFPWEIPAIEKTLKWSGMWQWTFVFKHLGWASG